MGLNSGERQVAPKIEGIRHDHVARYVWAAEVLPPASRVIDIACGVGYGARILAECGHTVYGCDSCKESIAYAREHYAHDRAAYGLVEANKVKTYNGFSAAVCFETVEHLSDPRNMLLALRKCEILLASVPNEDVFPYENYKFHFRHYRPAEFEALLNECGWKVEAWFKQDGPWSDVEPGQRGRTTIVKAVR